MIKTMGNTVMHKYGWISNVWAGRTTVNKFPCDLMIEKDNLRSATHRWEPVSLSSYHTDESQCLCPPMTQMRASVSALLWHTDDIHYFSPPIPQMRYSISDLISHTDGIHYTSVLIPHTSYKICSLLYCTVFFFSTLIQSTKDYTCDSLTFWLYGIMTLVIALCLLWPFSILVTFSWSLWLTCFCVKYTGNTLNNFGKWTLTVTGKISLY